MKLADLSYSKSILRHQNLKSTEPSMDCVVNAATPPIHTAWMTIMISWQQHLIASQWQLVPYFWNIPHVIFAAYMFDILVLYRVCGM